MKDFLTGTNVKFDKVDRIMHMIDRKIKLIFSNNFSSKDNVLLPLLLENFWKSLGTFLLQNRGGGVLLTSCWQRSRMLQNINSVLSFQHSIIQLQMSKTLKLRKPSI